MAQRRRTDGFKAAFAGVDARAFIGSGLFWAWVDALFMSAFFGPFGDVGSMPQVATELTSLVGVPLGALALAFPARARAAVASTRALVAAGVVGTAGSLLFVAAAAFASWPALVVGAVLAGAFMAASVLAWGAVYCSGGAQTATLYVAGGFALALVPDLFFLAMVPPVSSFAFAALPAVAIAFLVAVPAPARAYASGTSAAPRASVPAAPAAPAAPRPSAPSVPAASASRPSAPAAPTAPAAPPASAGSRRSCFASSLGVSFSTVCALALVMLGIGYVEQQVSYSSASGIYVPGGGAPLQIVRGLVATALFALILVLPRRAHVAYRVGLLAIVAGFSLMPLLYDSRAFWASCAVAMAGYAAFDVLIWIVVAQVGYARRGDAFRAVVLMQLLIKGLCNPLGSLLGSALGQVPFPTSVACADAILVGYLMTVAVVLLLSNRDIWELFDARPPIVVDTPAQDTAVARLDALASSAGLTDREHEVARLLAQGRTQPWIAEALGISESTVNYHVRHIYAKLGIQSKQELLDLVVCGQPTEPVRVPEQS